MDGTNLESNEFQKLNDPWQTQDATVKEIKDRQLPVNYSEVVADAKVVFLADENHSDPSIRRHISEHARDLKAAGITHYAIEANEEGNRVLERLNRGEQVDLSQIDVGPGRADYEEAIKALSAQGIKVVAIDIDQKTRPSKEEREARITENINSIIETNPDAKVAVLIGAFHTSRHYVSEGIPSVGRRLMEAQIPTVNMHFAGGVDNVPKMLTGAVGKAGLSNQEFMLDFRHYADLKSVPFGKGEADWVIHLPQQ
jgi:hypothetical protein